MTSGQDANAPALLAFEVWSGLWPDTRAVYAAPAARGARSRVKHKVARDIAEASGSVELGDVFRTLYCRRRPDLDAQADAQASTLARVWARRGQPDAFFVGYASLKASTDPTPWPAVEQRLRAKQIERAW